MSSSAIRSGRGARLPGMGTPAAAPASAATVPEPPTATPATGPRARRSAERVTDRSSVRRGRGADERKPPAARSTGPPYIPHAGDTKVQVNPRIYQGIWSHYEQLVDELPRDRRRGALTALVNAVLAQHAPHNVAEARAAISWLRQAEARDTGS